MVAFLPTGSDRAHMAAVLARAMRIASRVRCVCGATPPHDVCTRICLTLIVSVGAQLTLVAGAHGAFPGANGKIAFTSGGEIVAVWPDGSGLTNLTRNPAVDSQPAWSPDGRRIAFTSTRDGNEEIYVMQADGSRQTRLTANSSPDSSPGWSPDGRELTFVGSPDIDYEVYAMSADGSRQRNLTKSPAQEEEPAWSPGGRRIAFISDRFDPDGAADIFTMRTDGSEQRRLTKTADSAGSAPDWSPEGLRLAYEDTDGVFDGNSQIFVMNADGSNPRNVSRNDIGGGDGQPAWSPDGRRIAFQALRGESFQIYTMSSNGSGQRPLIASDANQDDPDWQPIPAPGRAAGDTAPVLSAVSIRPKSFAPGPRRRRSARPPAGERRSKRSAMFRFALSEPARVIFSFERRRKGRRVGRDCRRESASNAGRRRCYRYILVGGLVRPGSSGRNRMRFRGRVAGKMLRPGRYRATLRARDVTGNRSRARRLAFTIRRR